MAFTVSAVPLFSAVDYRIGHSSPFPRFRMSKQRSSDSSRDIDRLDNDQPESRPPLLMTRLTPVIVPPVPTPETRISTRPSVSFEISSAVVDGQLLRREQPNVDRSSR